MRRAQLTAIVLCLLTFGSTAVLAGDAKSDVAAAYAAFNAAFNHGDAKALAGMYVTSAEILPPTHAVVSGASDIEKFFAGFFANGVTNHALEIIDVGGDDKIVFATSHWSAKAKGTDGTEQNIGGLATHVFERQPDGSLKLRLHTFN